MTSGITDSMRLRLADTHAAPKLQDLYSGSGADFYQRLVGPDKSEVREVLALARSIRGEILDIAAGSGRLTLPLIRSGKKVTAIDLSADMLSILQHAAPDSPLLDCVVADMRSFTLGRRYDLAVIGATSITLLDHAGRRAFYASVRDHLSEDGVFAITIAGAAANAVLGSNEDRTVTVDGDEGTEDYLYSQQVIEGGAARLVNWARCSEINSGGEVTVLTSKLRVLDAGTLHDELIEAGFTQPRVRPVRTHVGADLLILETSLRRETRPR